MSRFLWVVLFVGLLSLSTVSAANIIGTIYDNYLNVKGNVVVKINSTPKQTFVSKTGKYRFQVPIGIYNINATYISPSGNVLSGTKQVIVNDYRDYNIDMILYPQELDDNKETTSVNNPSNNMILVGSFVLLALIGVGLWLYHRKTFSNKEHGPDLHNNISTEHDQYEQSMEIDYSNTDDYILVGDYSDTNKNGETRVSTSSTTNTENLDNDLTKIIQIIDSEGGRTTQRQIRRQMPYSEAKISLMISELVERNLIIKIKKGRGNIIIRKKG